MTDQIALVLGGTSPHVELINKLKQRGYYVILVDYLNNSPGIAAADQHIQESTLDKEKGCKSPKRPARRWSSAPALTKPTASAAMSPNSSACRTRTAIRLPST